MFSFTKTVLGGPGGRFCEKISSTLKAATRAYQPAKPVLLGDMIGDVVTTKEALWVQVNALRTTCHGIVVRKPNPMFTSSLNKPDD